MKKIYVRIGALVTGLLLFTGIASAHVVVKPNQANVGAFQTFTMGVPVEKDVATVGLRLVIPEGLSYVTPNVKQGWKITTKKSGTGEDATVTEISWTGGSIPAGQRDEFSFSAKVPAAATTVSWKAYQTYADGTVVSWDAAPGTIMDEGMNMGPYSETKIVDDLAPVKNEAKAAGNEAIIISTVAVVLSGIAFNRTRKQK